MIRNARLHFSSNRIAHLQTWIQNKLSTIHDPRFRSPPSWFFTRITNTCSHGFNSLQLLYSIFFLFRSFISFSHLFLSVFFFFYFFLSLCFSFILSFCSKNYRDRAKMILNGCSCGYEFTMDRGVSRSMSMLKLISDSLVFRREGGATLVHRFTVRVRGTSSKCGLSSGSALERHL